MTWGLKSWVVGSANVEDEETAVCRAVEMRRETDSSLDSHSLVNNTLTVIPW